MRAWLIVACCAAMSLALTAPGHAATPDTLPVEVSDAWIRVLPAGLPAGGYARLHNRSDSELIVTGATSPAYAHIMLHRSSHKGGMSRMHAVDKLRVPAHDSVRLAPGGYHLMLMQARHTIKPGDTVPVTLHFADGRSLTVDFRARPANANGPD